MSNMELLNFKMPPFARMVWASKAIKDKWEPRFNAAVKTYHNLERNSVKYGLRDCYTTHLNPNDLAESMLDLSKERLYFMPIQRVGQYTGFSHVHLAPQEGKRWNYYGPVSHNLASAKKFIESSIDLDHKILGGLLGYPACCTEFFLEKWAKGYIDPVWQYAVNTKKENVKRQGEHFIRIKDSAPFETNTLLKYMGIRILPHITCSIDCEHSVKMARDWIQLGRDIKDEGLECLLYFLQMPVEWDCLKGVAYISTPLFKIETNSVACYPNYVLQKEGTVYPEEAPKGLKFPWNEVWKFQGLQANC